MRQLSSVYKTRKKILIYRKYVCNLGQSNSDLFADYIHAKIVIVLTIDMYFLGRQYDAIMQLARHSLEQPLYYENVSFGNLSLPNCEGLAYLINKVVQSN